METDIGGLGRRGRDVLDQTKLKIMFSQPSIGEV
jgi:hypothetical protein